MSSPARAPHGGYQLTLATIVARYKAKTPGVDAALDATVFLDARNEPQPDLFLRIKEECGGKSWVNSEKYLEGAPELVAEIAYSTRAIDLHAKKENYARAGILEYIVVCVEPKEVIWFDLKRNRQLPRDAKGVVQSQVFPGLWLDTKALLGDDLKRALRTLNRGLATKEHAEFVQRLNRRSKHNGKQAGTED
ncbi:MAG: Uma2 family endonuclease [Planctomycetia bacterium]|nr:Uma2 family endonuclease [Planctomycetia bacterium]